MPRIDQETVNRILDAADIVDVVSDFVKLRRSGANFKGLCPFHNERTPSFSVNKARNICKCFSCGKGGTPVNFIMEHEQMSYQEALRYLARKYNIEIVEKDLTDEERRAESDREAMLAVNEFALKHFKENLMETPDGRDIAFAYFRHRGLSDAMIARFHLGYSIDRSTALLNAAKEAGFNEKYLVATGLAVQTDRPDRPLYDRFRGRVMFPIHSISGRVVGFGGRTMRSDKTIAKYVNSPESEVYVKNRELYGLYQAKNSMARKDKCILVEGYLDVISMHQAGVENVVASSGTSLTEGQIKAIRRFTENVTLIYDADPAGIKASLRGINLLLAQGLNVKVLLLPPGDDPDSFAQSHTSAEVEEYLAANEQDIIAFMAEILLKDLPPNDPTAKAKVVNVILQSVAQIDEPVKRQEYITQCSRLLGLPEEVLVRQLNIFIGKRFEELEKADAREKARESAATLLEPEKQPESRPEDSAPLLNLENNTIKPYEEMLIRYLVRYALLYVVDISNPDGSISPGTVFDLIDGELRIDNYAFMNPTYAAVYQAVKAMRYETWPADKAEFEARVERKCEEKMEAARADIRSKATSIAQIEDMERAAQAEIDAFRQAQIADFDIQYCQSRMCNSADDNVRITANELLVDRYTLSKIYAQDGKIETEQEQLAVLVPRAVDELRNAILSEIISDLTRKLGALSPDDADTAMELMQQLAMCKNMQKNLVKTLGERIILPRG